MLLQPSLHNHNPSISPSLSYAHPLQSKISPIILRQSSNPFKPPAISCSVSQVHSYNTVDYERRPMVKWNAVYKRISLMESPELGAATVLNQCEDEGKKLTKWELCRVVKELRKYRRYKPALETAECTLRRLAICEIIYWWKPEVFEIYGPQ